MQNENAQNSQIHQFLKSSLKDENCEVLKLAGDASARRYYRVVSKNKSYVLMHWEPFENENEYPFLNIQRHFKKHGVQVPEVRGFCPQTGAVLLEDLGDLTLERKVWENQNPSAALPYYYEAVSELIKIHYPVTEDKDDACLAFQTSFDTEKLLWEMNYGKEHLIEKLVGAELSPAQEKSLSQAFTSICAELDKEEKRICHRDFHSRNLMIKLGKVRVIDFQDARLGPIQYDLVSLTHDSYVNLPNEFRALVVEDYLTKANEALSLAKTNKKESVSRDHFFHIYRLQIIQRVFKACGSFASFYNSREDLRYLKYLTPSLIRVHEVLSDFEEYSGFKGVIEDLGLLDLNYLNPTEMNK